MVRRGWMATQPSLLRHRSWSCPIPPLPSGGSAIPRRATGASRTSPRVWASTVSNTGGRLRPVIRRRNSSSGPDALRLPSSEEPPSITAHVNFSESNRVAVQTRRVADAHLRPTRRQSQPVVHPHSHRPRRYRLVNQLLLLHTAEELLPGLQHATAVIGETIVE